MKVLYKTRGATSESDPLGQLGEGTPEILEAKLIGDTLYFEGRAANHTISLAQEGNDPGEWRRVSRLSTSTIDQIKAMYQTLFNDADSDVANAAKISAAIITGNIDTKILQQLRNTAISGGNKTLRLFAIILITLLIIEERD